MLKIVDRELIYRTRAMSPGIIDLYLIVLTVT